MSVQELPRDAGLVRTVGTLGLAASIINMVVGAGIFVVPAAMAAAAGSRAYLAFLICALAMGAVVLCFAEGGRRIPTSGGAYGYIECAFGPLAASIAGTLLWVGNVVACGGVAAALGDSLASVFPSIPTVPVRSAGSVVAIGWVAAINLRGAASATRFVSLATPLKLVPLIVFVVAGTIAMSGSNPLGGGPTSPQGFGRAVILAMFTFTGMETALGASGEVSQPARAIPRALIAAMTFVTVLYVSIQVIAQRALGSTLATSQAPLAEAMGHVSPVLRYLLIVGATMSMFSWMGSDLLGSPRILFAMARDDLLPVRLGRVHPTTHAPHVAIVCYAVIAVLLALTGTFAELVVLATLASAALYLMGCAAVWKLATDAGRGTHAKTPRILKLAAAVGIASMLLVIFFATAVETAGLGAMIAVGVLSYVLRRRLRRIAAISDL